MQLKKIKIKPGKKKKTSARESENESKHDKKTRTG